MRPFNLPPTPDRISPADFQARLTDLKQVADRKFARADRCKEWPEWVYWAAVRHRLDTLVAGGACNLPSGEEKETAIRLDVEQAG